MIQTRTPIAIITGGSRGLGKNMVQKLTQRGADVIFTYRFNRAEADALVAELTAQGRRVTALQLDTGKIATFPAFAGAVRGVPTRWKAERLDYLVSNAGVGVHTAVTETIEAQFDELMNVHSKGVFSLTQILPPLMVDGGRIVNISPGLARFALPGYGAYAAMKGVAEVLTRYLAKELGSRGIVVNVVTPDAIETDFGGGAVHDNASLSAMVVSNTALGRAGLPDDIGGMVVLLLSPDNRRINTQRTEASGGMFL